MANNLLDRLKDTEVPQRPEDFDRQVHQRLNAQLLVTHVADLVLRGLPYAVGRFFAALAGLAMMSLFGTFEPKTRGDADASDRQA